MSESPPAADEKSVGRGERRYRVLSKGVDRHAGAVGLALVLGAGTLARIVLSTRQGHLWDVDLFLRWMRGLVESGLGGFYAADASCNYPPLFLLILRGLGGLLAWWAPGLADTAWLRAFLRLPACLADVGIALVLYFEVRRLRGPRTGVFAAALYFLNPVALYDSAYWGQVDSIHSGLVLCALVALNRQRPLWAGATIVLALLQKLQALAFVPLVLFDVYRWKRWRGLAWCLLGGGTAALLVLAPFLRAGTARVALERGYVRVVGQYSKLSQNAFNIWYATGHPKTPDDSVPVELVRAAAAGRLQVAEDASWTLQLTYRRIGMALFTLAVATILTLYSRRYTAADRSLAAGLLGSAFFLCLTEMHERYAFPIIAVLPIWAVQGRGSEGLYLLLSILMLLNLTVAQPVEEIGGDLAVLTVVLSVVGLGALVVRAPSRVVGAGPPQAGRPHQGFGPCDGALDFAQGPGSKHAPGTILTDGSRTVPPAVPPSVLVTWFGRITLVGVLGAVGLTVFLAVAARRASLPVEPGVLYLGELVPVAQKQDYGHPTVDRSVEGGPIRLGARYYLRGLGTHAHATLVYDLPDGYRVFKTLVGVNRHFAGSARGIVYLDNRSVFSSHPFTAQDAPVEIEVPLGGARRLKLVASPTGSVKGAHVDWALARLEK